MEGISWQDAERPPSCHSERREESRPGYFKTMRDPSSPAASQDDSGMEFFRSLLGNREGRNQEGGSGGVLRMRGGGRA